MNPFLNDASTAGFNYTATVNLTTAIGALAAQDAGGTESILGSRLIPVDVYRKNATGVQQVYEHLFGANISCVQVWLLSVLSLIFTLPASVHNHVIGGGKVSENRDISSSINPKWRDAKTHVCL